MRLLTGVFVSIVAVAAAAKRIVLTNDDGWAVAQIRAEFDALVAAGHDVRTRAPSYTRLPVSADFPATPGHSVCAG